MAGLIPWRHKRSEQAGSSGGGLTRARDFPTFISRLQDEFDKLFDRFEQNLPAPWSGQGGGWRWGLDTEDKEDSIVVRAEAPGFEPGDFNIQVSDNRLTLRASRQKESKEKGGEFRQQYECYESMLLPPGIDADKIDATYRNGVLTVTIPKTKEGRGKKIPVKS